MKALFVLSIMIFSTLSSACDFSKIEELKMIKGSARFEKDKSFDIYKGLKKAKEMAIKDCIYFGGKDCKIYSSLVESALTLDPKTKQLITVRYYEAEAHALNAGQEEKMARNCEKLNACDAEMFRRRSFNQITLYEILVLQKLNECK